MTSARSIRWGITFIAVGIFWLLADNNVIAPEVFLYAVSLWPLLLVAIGIEMIFKRTKAKGFAFVSPLLIALALLLVGIEAYHEERGDTSLYHSSFTRNINTGVATLRASIELGDYDLYARARSGNKVRGKMVCAHSGPKIEFSQDASEAELEIKDSNSWFSWGGRSWPLMFTSHGFSSSHYPEYRLDVPEMIPLEVSLSGAESNAELNLTHASLRKLLADLEEVRLKLRVGADEPLVDVTISGKDNQVSLLFPDGGGVRIDGDGITTDLGGYLTGKGLEKDGDVFLTPGFDSLTPQIRLRIDDDLQRLRVESYDVK